MAATQLQAATHRIHDGARLLENLLQHEVRITTFFDAFQLHLQFLDVWNLAHVFAAANVQLPIANNHDFVVIHIHHFVGILDDGCGIGGNKELAFANTNHHRRAFAGRNKLIGRIPTKHYDGVGTYYFVQSQAHGLF